MFTFLTPKGGGRGGVIRSHTRKLHWEQGVETDEGTVAKRRYQIHWDNEIKEEGGGGKFHILNSIVSTSDSKTQIYIRVFTLTSEMLRQESNYFQEDEQLRKLINLSIQLKAKFLTLCRYAYVDAASLSLLVNCFWDYFDQEWTINTHDHEHEHENDHTWTCILHN